MANRRDRLFRLMLFVSVLIAFGQFSILNHAIKGFLWGYEENTQQEDDKVHQRRDSRVHQGQAQLVNEDQQENLPVKDGKTPEISAKTLKAVKLVKPRPTKGTMNSFISPYHKHWEVNCSAILTGNKKVVKETNTMLKKLRDDKDYLPIPSDSEVEKWMGNCSEFKTKRHYLDVPLSVEEENYPLAYIIVTHTEAVQVERLLRSIYQPQNVYCIHPDRKSPASYQNAIRKLASCFDNVFIASKLESVQYAGFTRLQADINCMSDLLKNPVKWKYVFNLCGQDFPLKTNLEIVRQLKAYNGLNDINGIIPPSYIAPRTMFHHKMDGKRPVRTKRKKSPAPHNLTIYFGNAYYAATHEFVDFVINDKVAIDLLEWSEDTWSPDEHYWVTLQRSPYSPGGYPNATWDANVRFMKWGDVKKHPGCQGKYVRALCVFGVGYLEYLHRQPHLFANKFYYSYDPVALQCIEEMLDHRTWHPEDSDKLDNFPVVNLVWQSYKPKNTRPKKQRTTYNPHNP